MNVKSLQSTPTNLKSVIILGIRGLPAAHGGFETFAQRLSEDLISHDWAVTVYCQAENQSRRSEDYWRSVRRINIPTRFSGSLGTIEFDIKSTIDALRQAGVVLTLGYNTGFLGYVLKAFGRLNYVNMDGVEWKRTKYGLFSRAFLFANERFAAWSATRMIADHPEIAVHLARGSKRKLSKIAVIPYGSSLISQADMQHLLPLNVEPGGFFTVIARPEPENQLLEIVRAFASVENSGLKLVVLGRFDDGNSYHRSVINAANQNVVFAGAIYDKDVLAAIRLYCIAYIHGHKVGGTNPSLVEALGAGSAVIADNNRFNRWVAADAAIYFNSVEECAEMMEKLASDAAIRDQLRCNAKARWAQCFTWPEVLLQYRQLLSGGDNQDFRKPAFSGQGEDEHCTCAS